MGRKIWANSKLRGFLCELFIKDLLKECDNICHEQTESILRKTKPEDFMNFTFDKMDGEMKTHCPLFRDVLRRAAIKKISDNDTWLPAVCMAASLVLKCRQPKMWALQKMLDMLEDGEKKMLPRCLLEHRYIYLPPGVGFPSSEQMSTVGDSPMDIL